MKANMDNLNRIKGSLFGGAIGDALGYPVEFLHEKEIRRIYGNEGITSYVLDKGSRKALISDDTQMTLFTANGLLVCETKSLLDDKDYAPCDYISKSYKDWLKTQEISYENHGQNGISWLCNIPELYSRRAPGNTCLSALREETLGTIQHPINNSKGCGGIMRVAPLALLYRNIPIEQLDMETAEIAALTHGHSLGYMSAAVLNHILSSIIYPKNNLSLEEIIIDARDTINTLFKDDIHINELSEIINRAITLSHNTSTDLENIHELGEGWIAEETLAIAIYCSLKYQNDFSKGIITAVNHNGDSDSTGAVTGNILGAWLGFDKIEDKWTKDLELSDVINEMAMDLYYGCQINEFDSTENSCWKVKYIDMECPGK